jgi:RNA polymerase sigma factor (sigma-70 family)
MVDTTTRLDDWLVRLRAHEPAALNELIAYFQRRLEALAHKMLTGFPVVAAKEQTGDVLQEALLHFPEAIRALAAKEGGPAGTKTFHGPDFFRFAATLIRRELIDLADRHRRRPAGPLPADSALAGSDGWTWNPARLAEWTELHEAAAKLSDQIRDVFNLIYYDGLSQKEAAEVLGVSDRTVRSRWQEASLLLVETLGSTMPGP